MGKKFFFLVWLLSFGVYAQDSIKTNHREHDLYQQNIDLKIENAKKDFKHFKELIQSDYKYLNQKQHTIDWWLDFMGIMITFFGIGIPVIGFSVYKAQKKEFEKHLKETEDMKEKIKSNLKKLMNIQQNIRKC